MTTKSPSYRFSLRVAMGVVVVCGVLLALVARPAHQRERTIADIRSAGGVIQ